MAQQNGKMTMHSGVYGDVCGKARKKSANFIVENARNNVEFQDRKRSTKKK